MTTVVTAERGAGKQSTPTRAGTVTPLRLAIDIGFAASAYLTGAGKFGILRVTDELVRELGASADAGVTAVGLSHLSGEPLFDSFVTVLGARKAFPGIAAEHCVRSRFGLWGLYERLMPGYAVRTLTPGQAASPAARAAVKLLKQGDCVPDFSPERFDLFVSLLSALPSRAVTGDLPRVLNVYDLICVRHPEWCTTEQVDWQRNILGSIDAKRDWLVCNSEYVRADVCDYLKMDPERVAVVPLGVSADFRPVGDASAMAVVRAKYGVPADVPYLLSLAALQPRKNLAHLIRCFTRLLSEEPSLRETRLVLAGERGWKFDEIINTSNEGREFSDRVVFTGYVADEDLSALYSGAHGFVFPSLSEGFGLPPLEAMACGTPVIAARATSLPEVVTDGAGILVDPHDADALCAAMKRLLKDEALREELSRGGREWSSAFTWARTAEEMLAFGRRVVAASGRERRA